MIIRELKPSQHKRGRWLAVMEDGSVLRLGENEVIQFSLYTGRKLGEEEAQALLDSTLRSERKEKALSLLARKPMSRWELERKMGEWGAAEEEIAATCDRLEELGMLNDAAYAQQVVRHYSAKGFGVKKLRDELYRRGVARMFWDEALEQAEDPSNAIDEFIRKKLAGRAPDRKELQKISAALARRGYGWSDIRDALGRCGAETGDYE